MDSEGDWDHGSVTQRAEPPAPAAYSSAAQCCAMDGAVRWCCAGAGVRRAVVKAADDGTASEAD